MHDTRGIAKMDIIKSELSPRFVSMAWLYAHLRDVLKGLSLRPTGFDLMYRWLLIIESSVIG